MLTTLLKNIVTKKYLRHGRCQAFSIIGVTMLLAGCLGGQGSADNDSIVGTALGADNVELQVPLFYVKRILPNASQTLEEPYAFNPGAQLYMRPYASSLAPEINISALIHGDNLDYDVKDLEISPDGKRLLFSMHPPEADPDNPVNYWSIWEYNIESGGAPRKIISDDFIAAKGQGHDFNASYLPLPSPNNSAEIAIVFSSTRQDSNRSLLPDEFKPAYSGLEEDSAANQRDPNNGAIHAVTLHTYDESIAVISEQMRQITFNQSHDLDPLVLPTGEIVYTRWDNINNHNRFSLYKINPDGTNNTLMYGYHSHATSGTDGGEGLIMSMQAVDNGDLLGLLRDRELEQETLGGAIVQLDINNYIDRNTPTDTNAGLLNPAFSYVSPNDVYSDNRVSPGGRFSSVKRLYDGSNRMLVSWTPCLVSVASITFPCDNNTTPQQLFPLYGLWLFEPNSTENIMQPILSGDPGYMYTDAVTAEAREDLAILLPPTDNLMLNGSEMAILNIKSIYDIDGVDTTPSGISVHADPAQTPPANIEAKFLRLTKAVYIPDESVYTVDNSAFGINRSQLMREIIGYLPIETDGSVRGLVPANLPLMLDIVDANGMRIGGRHQNWISFGANETFECTGCHTAGSTAPHGRVDAQPASVNPGAPLVGIFPNTVQPLGDAGLTMAENYARYMGSMTERTPNADLNYVDEWSAVNQAPAFTINYNNLTTTNDPRINCGSGWDPLCRIVINYEDHIQPIWEAIRTPVDDGTGTSTTVDQCTDCHTRDANGTARIPAGQLDLTNTASDINGDHLTSYRELLQNDIENVLNGNVVQNRVWRCNVLDQFGDPVLDNMGNNVTQDIALGANVPRSMNQAGARASSPFFNCLTQDNACRAYVGPTIPSDPNLNCMEFGGTPVTNEPVINHNGMLSAEELRLIAEWLDMGAQYYNNPFDAPSP